MNNIDLALILSGAPIQITNNISIYQPTLRDIVIIGEERYNAMLKIWNVTRDKLIQEETEQSRMLDDFEIWKLYILQSPQMIELLEESCLVFFRKKIEFLPITNTMYIGETEQGDLLDLTLFMLLKTAFSKIDPSSNKKDDDNEQYKETQNMSAVERRIYEQMKAGQAKLDKIKNKGKNMDDLLGRQIAGLAAIGHYTFKDIYDMTMLQFTTLLKKHIDVQNFELTTMLSPYMSSKDDNQEEKNKHWLD